MFSNSPLGAAVGCLGNASALLQAIFARLAHFQADLPGLDHLGFGISRGSVLVR